MSDKKCCLLCKDFWTCRNRNTHSCKGYETEGGQMTLDDFETEQQQLSDFITS